MASPQQQAWPSERVVLAAQRGDPIAISALIESSHPHVRRFAHSLCHSPQDAEDAVQEALLVLYRRVGTLRVTAALGSWMFQIVRRECMRRTHLPVRAALQACEGSSPTTEESALAHIEVERVIARIARLPREQREVLVLRDIRGLSGAETARVLGLQRAAMKSRLYRARQTVRGEPDPPREVAS
jgi:RNA polymerase sigma factor (sigma-70 family)